LLLKVVETASFGRVVSVIVIFFFLDGFPAAQ
jgi:hypothetical protein